MAKIEILKTSYIPKTSYEYINTFKNDLIQTNTNSKKKIINEKFNLTFFQEVFKLHEHNILKKNKL